MVYQNGKAVAISQSSVSFSSSQDIYSTEEQVVGRWIDGKPLYQIAFEAFSPSKLNSWAMIHPPIENAEIKFLLASILDPNDGVNILPCINQNSQPQCRIIYSPNDAPADNVIAGFRVYVAVSSFASKKITVIAKYTKASDPASIQIDDESASATLLAPELDFVPASSSLI